MSGVFGSLTISEHLSDRANAVVGPLILKPLVQTPLVKLMLWMTTGARGLCLDWTRLDELRYRLHLKAVHEAIKAIPTHFQYLPLARDQRAHYRRTGAVAPTRCRHGSTELGIDGG
jgi:hypothetical protein